MKRNNFDSKISDIKRAEQARRTELGMLDLLMNKYPIEAEKKMRKLKPTFGQTKKD